MKNVKEYKLALGEQVDMSINIFSRSITLCYTGQVQDYVYSVAIITTKGNNSYAYNVYFNADQKEFKVFNGTIKINQVDARYIDFAYVK